jgi:hypothetical protein
MRSQFAVASVCLLALAGCQKEEAPVKFHPAPPPPAHVRDSVEGHIRYHGSGLPSGYVQLYDESGTKVVTGPVMMGGTYTVWDPPHGKVKVAVTTRLPEGLSKAPPPTSRPGVIIPTRYADPDTSGLTFTVKGGKQTFDIYLED